MPPLTPEQLAMRARAAAHAQWAKEPDPTARTAAKREAFYRRFEREARELHPDGSEELIARSAEHLRKAYMARLALASSRARSRAKGRKAGDGDA
jgi:hypothetical protein